MIYIKSISLDITCENYNNTQYAKQGDKDSRVFEVTLFENNTVIDLSKSKAQFRIQKPNGKLIVKNMPIEDDKIIVTLSDEMLLRSGTAFCDIIIFDDNNLALSTARFKLIIEPVVSGDDTVDYADLSFRKISEKDFYQLNPKDQNTVYYVIGDKSIVEYMGDTKLSGGIKVGFSKGIVTAITTTLLGKAQEIE